MEDLSTFVNCFSANPMLPCHNGVEYGICFGSVVMWPSAGDLSASRISVLAMENTFNMFPYGNLHILWTLPG